MKVRKKILTLVLSAMMMLSLVNVKEVEAASWVGYVRGTAPTITARGDNTKIKYEFAVDEDNGPLTAVYVTFSWNPDLMTFDQTTTLRDNMILANVDVVGGTLDAYLDSGMRDEKCGVTLSFTNVLPEGRTETEAAIDITFKAASIPSNPNGLEFSGDDWEYLNLEHIDFQQTGKIKLLENQTLTFDTDGGSPTPTSITQLEGSSINLSSITAPTKAGYQFDGWYSGVTKYENTITMPAGGLALKAHWTALDQTIAFDTDGGSTAPSNIVQATGTAVDLALVADPTKEGYQFDGWYVGSTKYSGTITMPAGGLNLVAHYVGLDQTIAFDTDGGSTAPSNIVQGTGTTVNLDLVAAPTKTGHQFDGWYVGATKYSGNITMPVGGLNLMAKWKVNVYDITFDKNGGTGTMSKESYDYGQEKPLDKNMFTRLGYEFLGWAATPTGDIAFVDEDLMNYDLTQSLILYAKWNALDQTITFDTKGGSEAPASIVNKTDEIIDLSSIAAPTKVGYDFLGWYSGDTKYEGSFAMPGTGLNLEAKWNLQTTIDPINPKNPVVNPVANPAAKQVVNGTTNKVGIAKTGDTNTWLMYVLMMSISIVGIQVLRKKAWKK